MAKTKEELKTLKEEYESFKNKMKELTDDEITQIVGGYNGFIDSDDYIDVIDYDK